MNFWTYILGMVELLNNLVADTKDGHTLSN